MPLDTLISTGVPTAVVLVLAYLAKDKLKSFADSIASLVTSIAAVVSELKELRKEMAEIAVLRALVARCETEIGDLKERVRELETAPARRSA